MATFHIQPSSEFSRVVWADPARPAGTLGAGDPGAPSRLNLRAGIQQTRRRCLTGVSVSVNMLLWTQQFTVDDSFLDGRLYVPQWIEYPNMGTPAGLRPVFVYPVANFSSLVSFICPVAGHYLLGVTRAREGAVLFHFDAEDP